MKIYGNSDIGLVRRANEDSFRCENFSENTALLVVCDGMGGANGGSTASQMAVETIYTVLREGLHDNMEPAELRELLLHAVEEANMAVYRFSLAEPELRGMGTTVVAAVLQKEAAYIAHVGDSRAYHVKSEGIEQLTVDHSMVQELVRSGDLTALQAKTHPQKNIITRAVGVNESVAADFMQETFLPGDVLLLCTDGLTNYVEDDTILESVRNEPLEHFCNDLIALAKENGGGDNITIAAAKYC